MIQRVVLVKLKPQFASDAHCEQIERQTLEVLVDAHGVLSVEVARGSDARTRREWDLCILVRFASMDDVEAYVDDRVHRAYADVFLEPLRERIRVYNFVLAEGRPA